MAVVKTDNTEKNYTYLNGGFKGLYTALDPHLIPDGYLAALTNMEVDEQGVLHAVHPPATGSAGGWQRKIVYCGCPIWQDYSVSDTVSGTYVAAATTLGSADSFSPDGDIYTSGGGHDFTVYLNRLYYSMGNVLRYSGVSKAHLAKTWEGANAYNFQAFPYPITHLQPLQSGLYVIGDGIISRLTEPKTGSTAEVYYGPHTPVDHGVGSYIFNNSSSIVYCGTDGIYEYGGGGDPQRLDKVLTVPNIITKFYCAEYKNRLWVMYTPTGGSDVIYAINKTTGYWEYYNPATMVSGHVFAKIDWARYYSGYWLDLWDGSTTYTLNSFVETNTRMPWSFTTKDYTPSFDAYSRVVHVKFYYLGQTATSTATIQVYADGTLIDTLTQDMAGTGLLHKDYDCAATLANSFHLVVSGTGKADIIDAGIEFTQRRKGDPNA